jgi:hypothetical protein
MKRLLLILLFLSHTVSANECKTTTVTIEKDGKVSSETATVCKEGNPIDRTIKVGDIILESEVGEAKVTKYFNYNNSRCRMFSEHTAKDKALHVYYGVICQVDNSGANWLVVDKW